MFNKYRKINDKIVDIKSQINKFLVTLLIIIFPLNQQYHLKPFPSVDGFIIDYLILKVSIVEVLLFSIFILNVFNIFAQIKGLVLNWYFCGFLFFIVQSVLRSKYPLLSLYENLVLFLVFLIGLYIYNNVKILDTQLLSKSVRIWIVFLSLLGATQFITQKSVFNNYALTGEFPYSADYYHIKQKGLLFEEVIPPYAIFSHSNIFGAYIILLLVLLRVLRKDSFIFYLLTSLNLLIIGSSACILAFVIYLFSLKLDRRYISYLIILVPTLLLSLYFLNSFKYSEYQSNPSIYRRLYMFDLSSTYFIDNPEILLFGSGYLNYFSFIKSDLYRYELVRFFQPPHFSIFLIIWNYGILFLFLFFYLLKIFSKNLSVAFLRICLILITLLFFDHYLVTNHQLKILLMILIPYSLNFKNSI